MKCAYCGENFKATREHIIPAGILELFPECDVTYDSKRDKVYPNEAVIKDVCAKCNNDYLSELDSYGKKLISNNFSNERYELDESLYINFDYNKISRWIMKISFNDARANGYNDVFFCENSNYMLGIDKEFKRHFSKSS